MSHKQAKTVRQVFGITSKDLRAAEKVDVKQTRYAFQNPVTGEKCIRFKPIMAQYPADHPRSLYKDAKQGVTTTCK